MKLFGTDGIRAKAGKWPISSNMLVKIAQASYLFFESKTFLIGEDTRKSSPLIRSCLISGLASKGVKVIFAGVLPTGALAYLSHFFKTPSIMISASHNPFYDNGIKFFNEYGRKLNDAEEEKFEEIISNMKDDDDKIGTIQTNHLIKNHYITLLTEKFKQLKGLNILIDCANGAASKIAPKVFEKLNINFKLINNKANGTNINKFCGSEDTKKLEKMIKDEKFDLAIAFDGDADRVVFIDENGIKISTDKILGSYACFLKEKGKLKNNSIASTIMSNIGLSIAMRKSGIKHFISDVGDKKLFNTMCANDAYIGAENSGHMIFRDFLDTGDGILSALKILEMINIKQTRLSKIVSSIKLYPQILENIPVKEKKELNKIKGLSEISNKIEKKLNNEGRLFIRYSGTENILRVMLEGKDLEEIQEYAQEIRELCTKLSLD